jgi:ATP/maltotriose-dependent transcriptional regulator MalT
VLSVLTDGKRVSVINAPAGSGKTQVLTEAARMWDASVLAEYDRHGRIIGGSPSR